MKFSNLKTIFRPALTVILALLGALVAKGGAPQDILEFSGVFLMLASALAFGTLGFLLPDILEFAGKAGVTSLAKQIAVNIPGAGVRPLSGVSRFRFRRNKKISKWQNPLILDTSALIDGRIVDIAKTGFVWGTMLVIPSVVGELHRLADSHDNLRRTKGRKGLDALNELKSFAKLRSSTFKVEVLSTEPKDRAVDDKLISMGKKYKAKIISLDFNLNKVARIKSVAMLNINELASALRAVVLPQDRLTIKVSAFGKENTQGVGYMDDGTMVVVEDGANMKGRTIDVIVHKVLATAAGKMIFSRQAPTREES